VPNVSESDIDDVLRQAKTLAKKYRTLTGKPLGITGEVAEVSAAKLLGLTLAEARQSGFDAIREESGKSVRLQIKGRCLADGAKPGQRVGGIKLSHEWDAVLLVLMDEDFEVSAIWEAAREPVTREILLPGSKARNERGSLSISKFKSIGDLVWSREKVRA
jgi:hypothetical protein